jgi:hypothetical protein
MEKGKSLQLVKKFEAYNKICFQEDIAKKLSNADLVCAIRNQFVKEN